MTEYTISKIIKNGDEYSFGGGGGGISKAIFGDGSDGNCTICYDACTDGNVFMPAQVYNFDNLTICDGVKLRFCGNGVPILRVKNNFINYGTICLRNPLMECAAQYAEPYTKSVFVSDCNPNYSTVINMWNNMTCECLLAVGGSGSGGGGSGGGVGVAGGNSTEGFIGGMYDTNAGGGGASATGNGGDAHDGIGGNGASSSYYRCGGPGGGGSGLYGGGNGGGVNSRCTGGHGGNGIYGNGGNGGSVNSTEQGGKSGNGGCSYYCNGGNGGDTDCGNNGSGGNSVFGNGGTGGRSTCRQFYGGGDGGSSIFGNGGNGCSGGSNGNGIHGATARGGIYDLGLFASSICNEGDICGEGSKGSSSGGSRGAGLCFVYREYTSIGNITCCGCGCADGYLCTCQI